MFYYCNHSLLLMILDLRSLLEVNFFITELIFPSLPPAGQRWLSEKRSQEDRTSTSPYPAPYYPHFPLHHRLAISQTCATDNIPSDWMEIISTASVFRMLWKVCKTKRRVGETAELATRGCKLMSLGWNTVYVPFGFARSSNHSFNV